MTVPAASPRIVIVIGPNPAEDHILDVPGFSSRGVYRTQRYVHVAAGKPLNVARTLARLGIPPTLVIPLGSNPGIKDRVESACRDLDIDLRAVSIAGDTRTCTVIVDTHSGSTAVINETGPVLTAQESVAYENAAVAALRPVRHAITNGSSPSGGADIRESGRPRLAIASGSLPPGLPPDFYGRLAVAAREAGTRFILDSSGTALRMALEFHPWAVKVNDDEIREVSNESDLVEAAHWVRQQGVENVVVTAGPEGAIYMGTEGGFVVSPPEVDLVNTVGAGDAFSSGLVYGLSEQGSWKRALRCAAATSGLWVQRFEPDIGPDPQLEPLISQIKLQPIQFG